MSSSTENIDRVWALIKEISVAMVITQSGDGQQIRARPMAARPAQEEGAIFFLTDADAPKTGEIEREQDICLAMADNGKQVYLSISGRADVIDDRDRIKKIWSIYDKAFWRDANDPCIRILRVRPAEAEFWEGAGTVATAVKLVAASLSGARVDLGKSEKVRLEP